MKNIAYDGPSLEKKSDNAAGAPIRSKGSVLAPTLRTFQADAVGAAAKTTKFGLLMAERSRKEELGLSRTPSDEEAEPHLGRLILLLLLVLAFGIGVGLYILIGASFDIPLLSETRNVPEKNTILANGISIATGPSSREQTLKNIAELFANTTLPRKETRLVQLSVNDAAGVRQTATTSMLLRTLGTTAPPETLLRSLDPNPVYGIYAAESLTGFFLFRSRAYAETFAGMLAWESRMGDALIPAFHPKMKRSDVAALIGRTFKDERIAGIPARVLSDPDGITAIAYAFPDQKTLVIAGDRETLSMLIEQRTISNK